MIFYGIEFIIFFVVFLTGFYIFKNGAARSWYILFASYIFYGWWYPPYLILLFGLSLVAFWGGLVIRRQPQLLPLIVIALLLPLGFFKYAGFAAHINSKSNRYTISSFYQVHYKTRPSTIKQGRGILESDTQNTL